MNVRRKLFIALALLFSAGGAYADQKFPAKPLRLIVPAASDDPLSITARTLARNLTESFGQPVVVDNRPGGNYLIGTRIAVDAAPDGYTVIVVPSSYYASAAFHDLPYDSLND